MTYTYRFHPLTKQDYDEGYEWYEDKQKGLGERFLQAIRKKIEEIVLHRFGCKTRLAMKNILVIPFDASNAQQFNFIEQNFHENIRLAKYGVDYYAWHKISTQENPRY